MELIPVIVRIHNARALISGYSDSMLSQQYLAEQKDALLHKPFTPDLLARTVRDLLDTTLKP